MSHATPPPAATQPTSGMAIAGFVCSFFCGVVGLVLSILGLLDCNKTGKKGRGLAIAGIIISGSMAVLGILAAVAIPAFLDYMHKGKRTSSMIELEKIRRSLTVSYMEQAQLPTGSTGRTPEESCCTFQTRQCETSLKDWQAPIWRAIGYVGQPKAPFQYSYESTDGKTFTIRAIGDLDCDGTEVTYELHGRTVAGDLIFDEVIAPPPNSD